MEGLLPAKVSVTSVLDAGPVEVWRSISELETVNEEMAPWLNMAAPAGSDLVAAASGQVLPLKLRGPAGVPLGTYPLRLVQMDEGRGFLEQTWMLPFLLWQHERTIQTEAGRTRITDSLGWKWRARRLDPLVAVGVRRFFEHRHGVLRRRFG